MPGGAERRSQGTLPAQGPRTTPAEPTPTATGAIYGGEPFRTALRDLGLTSNRVWGLAKTDRNGQSSLRPH
jgi:hypothetical protein